MRTHKNSKILGIGKAMDEYQTLTTKSLQWKKHRSNLNHKRLKSGSIRYL